MAALAPGQDPAAGQESPHEPVLSVLRTAITSDRWQPGERLPVASLCKEFRISRKLLREVFRLLQGEGLVELRHRVGAVVTPLDPPDVAERFEVLMGFEQFGASKAARFRDPRVLNAIVRAQDAMRKALAAGDVVRYYELNDDFHAAIVSGANNAKLAERHHHVLLDVRRARHRVHEDDPAHMTSLEQHNAIIGYVLAGDEHRAGEAARVHLENIASVTHSRLRHGATTLVAITIV